MGRLQRMSHKPVSERFSPSLRLCNKLQVFKGVWRVDGTRIGGGTRTEPGSDAFARSAHNSEGINRSQDGGLMFSDRNNRLMDSFTISPTVSLPDFASRRWKWGEDEGDFQFTMDPSFRYVTGASLLEDDYRDGIVHIVLDEFQCKGTAREIAFDEDLQAELISSVSGIKEMCVDDDTAWDLVLEKGADLVQVLLGVERFIDQQEASRSQEVEDEDE